MGDATLQAGRVEASGLKPPPPAETLAHTTTSRHMVEQARDIWITGQLGSGPVETDTTSQAPSYQDEDYTPLGTPRVPSEYLGYQAGTTVKHGSDNEEYDEYRSYYKHHRWRRQQLCDPQTYDQDNKLLESVTMDMLPWYVVEPMLSELTGPSDVPQLKTWKKAPNYNMVNDQETMAGQTNINYKRTLDVYQRLFWRFGVIGSDNDQRPLKKLRGIALLMPHQLSESEQTWNEVLLGEAQERGLSEGDLHYRPRPEDFLVGNGDFKHSPKQVFPEQTVPFSRLEGK